MNTVLIGAGEAVDAIDGWLRFRGRAVERVAGVEGMRGLAALSLVVVGDGDPRTVAALRALPDGEAPLVIVIAAAANDGLLDAGADDIVEWPREAAHLDMRLAVFERRASTRVSKAARRDRTNQLSAVIEHAMEAIFIKDTELRYVLVNPAAARFFDRKPEEILGLTDCDLIDEQSGNEIQEIDRQVMQSRSPITYERVRVVNGRERVNVTSKVPYQSPSGEILGIMGISHDITARKRAEEALLQSERQFRAVFAATLDGMVILDDAGRCIGANAAAHVLFGLPRGELLGRYPAELLGGNPLELVAVVSSNLETPAIRDVRIVRQDGTTRDAELIPPRLILPGRYLLVLRDVTERKRMEGRLRMVDKMVSVGTLAAGVAHEINNPLAYVLANLSFLGEGLSLLRAQNATSHVLDDIGQALGAALDGAQRVRDIVSDLKTFSRADEEKRGPVDLRHVVEVSVRMVGNEIRHRARMQKELSVDLPPVDANESRLGQVLINLLQNAVQAMPERPFELNVIQISAHVEGSRAIVEVADNGCGIARDVLPRIFDPFFTTKPVGFGTGLGLSICHNIVTSMGGDISVESEVGHGTTFRLSLPVAVTVAPSARVAAPRTAHRARLLIVDDEPNIVSGVARMLRAHHDVVTETDPREALGKVRGEHFDAILCDLMMPGMTGMDLYAEVVRIKPDLGKHTGFLTGGAFTPRARAFVDSMVGRYLEKPFDGEALRSFVRGLLE